MSKKFVVGVKNLSTEQEKLLRDFFAKDGESAWWHWLDDFWLVHAKTDELTVLKLRDQISNISPGAHVLVLEISPITWAAFGPESEDHSFSRWVQIFCKEKEKDE